MGHSFYKWLGFFNFFMVTRAMIHTGGFTHWVCFAASCAWVYYIWKFHIREQD